MFGGEVWFGLRSFNGVEWVAVLLLDQLRVRGMVEIISGKEYYTIDCLLDVS